MGYKQSQYNILIKSTKDKSTEEKVQKKTLQKLKSTNEKN